MIDFLVVLWYVTGVTIPIYVQKKHQGYVTISGVLLSFLFGFLGLINVVIYYRELFSDEFKDKLKQIINKKLW